jgi:hypothetical protein
MHYKSIDLHVMIRPWQAGLTIATGGIVLLFVSWKCRGMGCLADCFRFLAIPSPWGIMVLLTVDRVPVRTIPAFPRFRINGTC